MNERIWLITGISKGIGKALSQEVIKEGDLVIGTFRDESQVNDFNSEYGDKGYAVKVDIRNSSEIANLVSIVESRFGKLDVLVNNAGIGLAGAIEETSMKEVRELFDINFFGSLEVTQSFLPIFRRQKSGHIIQVSSHSGFRGFPGFGIYGASKFALEGMSEALAAEIAPMGIRVTIVEPGPFRTDFAGESFKMALVRLEDYESTSGAFRERMKQVNGKQEGDPQKAAEAIFEISRLEEPPLRLPLGKIAVNTLRTKLDSVERDLTTWKGLAEAAVY